MITDLRAKPYFLNDDQIQWVENTIADMSDEEKIGQLFINLGQSTDEGYIKEMVEKYHIGGTRFTESKAEKVYEQNRLYQKYSKVPLLIAANCETGGDGACREGTHVATEAQCGATAEPRAAYEMGRIGGIEASAVGCNWTFGPMTDIVFNWRNTIVNTRSFGNDPEMVLEMSRAYIRGIHESPMLVCAKHFPGDGVEERDQHLVMGINSLSFEEWQASFGKVYKGLIEDGLEAMMVGHIALPDYSRRFGGVTEDREIKPASLAPELVTDLLRNRLGFQGLVVTDASHMGGLLGAMPRSRQVPGAIAAGCDMFLFFHDPKEDIQYMLDGYRSGLITEQRLQEALEHILGMKAKLGLYKTDGNASLYDNGRVPDDSGSAQPDGTRSAPSDGACVAKSDGACDAQTDGTDAAQPDDSGSAQPEFMKIIGCPEHQRIAAQIADASITLVKDTQHILPVDPGQRRRARLYYIESAPVSYSSGTDPARAIVAEELKRAGFEVDVNESYYDLELKESSPWNKFKVMDCPPVEEFKNKYDIVFVFVHMKGYAQENNMRVRFSAAHSNEFPWWVREVPTVCVSLNYTNHLFDLPMMQTFINAYAPTRACIRAAIEKITGQSEFKGRFNDNVWCDSWDTRR